MAGNSGLSANKNKDYRNVSAQLGEQESCRGVNYAKIIHWWDYCCVLCNGQRGMFNRDVHAMARVTASRASPRSLYARQVYTSPSPRLLMCTLSLLRVVLPPCAPRLKICLPAAMTSP